MHPFEVVMMKMARMMAKMRPHVVMRLVLLEWVWVMMAGWVAAVGVGMCGISVI